jgi:DNA-binding transcriptional LysR family regulator
MRALDDLKLLRTFVRIAESGSISAAARALSIPQPTVSRHLRQLEQGTGVVLIRRDTRALSLTAAGLRLLEDGRDLLSRALAATERISDSPPGGRTHLRILSVVDSGQWIVPRLLASFREQHPEITAELHLLNRPSKFIQEGFDCGVLVGDIPDRSVAVRRIGQIKRALVASPSLLARYGVPRMPAHLARLPWMGILQPHFNSRDQLDLVQGRKQQSIRFAPVLIMDSVTALREAAIAGAGIALQPEWLIGAALKEGRLVRVLPSWRPRPVELSVVFPTGRLPAGLRAFIDYASTHLPRLLADLEKE